MSEFNLKSSTIEKGIDLAKSFLERLVGPSVDEVGQLLADNVKIWKFNNQIGRLRKVQEKITQAGLEVNQVNLKVLFPWLEGAALENDGELQEMWENLLVNYIDPAKSLQVTVFPSILAQLSSEEIRILRYIPRKQSDLQKQDEQPTYIYVDPAAFANVERLGLIKHLESYLVVGLEGEKNFATETKIIWKNDCTPSVFGKAFLSACER